MINHIFLSRNACSVFSTLKQYYSEHNIKINLNIGFSKNEIEADLKLKSIDVDLAIQELYNEGFIESLGSSVKLSDYGFSHYINNGIV